MPFDIRCSCCGKTQELLTDSLVTPEGWFLVIVQQLGEKQTMDFKQRFHQCPGCGDGVLDRINKVES